MKSFMGSLGLSLLSSPFALSAETVLTDSQGAKAWLFTPSEKPDPSKTYWLAIGVHGAGGDGKNAGGIASWAGDDVIVLGPSFIQPPRDPEAPKTPGMPADAYQMAGPAHVEKLKTLIAEIGKTWKLHPKVFVHGFSAGAQFAHRLAMKEPDLLAGVSAASAGSWATNGFGELNPAARGIPFAISCGEYDRAKSWPEAPYSRIEWMKSFGDELRKDHFDIESRVIEGVNHAQNEETFELARSCFGRARALNLSRSSMIAMDFDGTNPLWKLGSTTSGKSVTAIAKWEPDSGTISQVGTATRTGALRFDVNGSPAAQEWSGSLHTGPLPLRCETADASLLSLAFDLSSNSTRPIRVTVESLNAEGKTTGVLTGLIHPAAPGFFHRHTLDFGSMEKAGEGSFNPRDPHLQVSLSIGSDLGWSAAPGHRLHLDNLSYTAPALFVGPHGKDGADSGTTADKPLATIQKAIDRAKPGDVIMVMDGTYEKKFSVAVINSTGTPAAWIVLRSHPGHRPVLKSSAWETIKIGQTNSGKISGVPAPGYIELRGITVQGCAAQVEAKHKDKIGKPQPETNGNGISIDGRFQSNKPHHIRIADCTVFECPGGGISAIHTDRVSIENNITRNNCHWTIYASSGISVYQTFNFESTPGEYRVLVRNNVTHDNFCTQPWVATGKPSDGNGLIVDDLRNTQNNSTNGIYQGRLLLQGNISYRNGGSGMHAFSSDRVDFIHNTAAGNNTKLDYTQIGITRCSDCRILNNILVAPADMPINRVNGGASDIFISHNVLWGGNGTSLPGENAVTADPQFVDEEKGDFRLKPTSPAIGHGGSWEIQPATYQNGALRPLTEAPTAGALPSTH